MRDRCRRRRDQRSRECQPGNTRPNQFRAFKEAIEERGFRAEEIGFATTGGRSAETGPGLATEPFDQSLGGCEKARVQPVRVFDLLEPLAAYIRIT